MSKDSITVEPLCQRIRGVTLDKMLSKEFAEALKKDMPTVVAGHLMIGFEDSSEVIAITHGRKDGKPIMDYLDVEGNDPEQIMKVVKAIQGAVK